jgi:hypothetical protein
MPLKYRQKGAGKPEFSRWNAKHRPLASAGGVENHFEAS